jgi:hypothetical protein
MSDDKRHQQEGNNSVSKRISMLASADEVMPLPSGVKLRSDEEMVIWEQFTRARARDDWRDMDLILLAKVVRVEADIRKYQEMVDKAGPLIKNKRETLIENPLIRVIDTYQRQQLAIIRSMSLNNQAVDPRTLQAHATMENEARETIKRSGAYALLASPMQ